jgi:hypothetical protein
VRALRIILMALALISLHAHAKDERNLGVNQVNNAVSDKRIALVIGNGAYTNSPLKNPVNDAQDIAAKLRGLGFDVIERHNLQTRQIGGTLREFRSKLVPGAVALVFYAGHGLQIKGENYLPAVDAEINSEEDVPNQSLAVKQIMDVLDDSRTRLNLVFLDACRNNPYARSFRSTDQGLARISAPSGTLISYATRPGSVAADGDGRNGLYTSKLLAQMDSNAQIEQTLKRVVTEVKTASQGKQEPWMEGSIEGDFCFGGCGASGGTQVANLVPAPAPVHVKSREEIEQETWENARDSASIGAVQEYLKQYPKGRFVGQAKVLIATLKATPVKFAEPVASSSREDSESALWNEVQKGHSKDDYDAYLAQYPKGKYAALAKSRIKKLQDEVATEAIRKEQEAWEAAGKSGSEDGYQGYLKDWPAGRYVGLAQARIRKLQTDLSARQEQELWQQAQAGENAQAVQAYLDKYPSGGHVSDAKEKLGSIRKTESFREEDALWKKSLDTATRAAMQDYLSKYPNGRYVTQARQQDEEYQRIPPRPEIPFAVSEEVWHTLETSAAYINLPRPRMSKISFQGSQRSEIAGLRFIDSDYKVSVTQEQTALGDKCTAMLRNYTLFALFKNSNSQRSYSCGYLISLGSTTEDGKPQTVVTSIDELKGSLFPMRIGAKMSIRFQLAYVPDRKLDQMRASTCEVVSQESAHELHSKLTGTAWKVHCQGGTFTASDRAALQNDIDDYYIEDIGMFLSQIGQRDDSGNRFVLPAPSLQTVTIMRSGEYVMRSTYTYTSYDWTVGE